MSAPESGENPLTSEDASQNANTPSTMYETGEYLANNAEWHIGDSSFKAAQVKTILDRNGIKPASFVEVGCGAGGILTELSHAFPAANFVGYDISPQAHALSQTRRSDRVEFRQSDFLATEDHYDCLMAMDVFEHVEDYMGFVRGLSKRATCSIFHIPMEINFVSILRGNMIDSRKKVGHLHYFSRDTALATLKDCGYDIVDDFYTESFRRLPRPALKNKLTGAIYRAVFSRSKDLAVKLFGDCSLIVLARPQK